MNTALIQCRGEESSPQDAITTFLAGHHVSPIARYGDGSLVAGAMPLLRNLQDADPERFLVLIYENVDVLTLNGYRITLSADGEATTVTPPLPPQFTIPVEAQATYPEFILQFRAPPRNDWVRRLQAEDFEVVAPIGRTGLHVRRGRDASWARLDRAEMLRFLHWVIPFHPAFRVHPALQAAAAPEAPRVMLEYVAITVTPAQETNRIISLIQAPFSGAAWAPGQPLADGGPSYNPATGEQLWVEPASAGAVVSRSDTTGHMIVALATTSIARIAHHPAVRWMQMVSRNVRHDGEFETQILAGNLRENPQPPNTPVPGYTRWLADVGLSGDGVIVAICDSGVDLNAQNNTLGHLDLRGRQAAYVDYTGGRVTSDIHGHGTHMAGVIVGNAAVGETEATLHGAFLYGQGVAPLARYVTLNATALPHDPRDNTWWPPADFSKLSRDALDWGARVMNCSWSTDPTGTVSGYTAFARQVDELVRDPTGDGAPLDTLISVWSAGNVPSPTRSSITEPKEAKNPIVVGNSLNLRPHRFEGDDPCDPAGISGTSAHGPAGDNRFLPTIVAPGMDVPSALAAHAADPVIIQSVIDAFGQTIIDIADPHTRPYALLSGTSTAAAHVSGVCVLLVEWWERTRGRAGLSPALAKALLVNSAVDLVGGPDGESALDHIPDNHQGWGRVSIENLFLQRPADGTPASQSALPSSDRGTRLLFDRQVLNPDPTEPDRILAHTHLVAPCATNIPLRITLAWTDAPGSVGASPTLVNNLDLEVYEHDTGVTYRGNDFHNGWSAPHPTRSFDHVNNVECVYIREPRGLYTVRVIAASLLSDARPPYSPFQPWQDYALVFDNARSATTTPIRSVALLDRSTSMRVLAAFSPARLAAAHYVQILRPTDEVAVLSFNDTVRTEYGDDGATSRVDGSEVPDAASACIHALNTSSSSALGDALTQAIALARGTASMPGGAVVVLWSDGHEAGGTETTNDALHRYITSLGETPPKGPVRVHTVALFPAAKQDLLQAIASRTGGTYGYAPNEAALHLLNNTFLASHTGDALVVNETVTVSTFPNRPSSIGVCVAAGAKRVTITVAWSDTTVVYAPGVPASREDLDILLVDPNGRRIPANASEIRRHVRPGLVLFEIPQPRSGRWVVVLRTLGAAPLRCTVGALVPSSRVLRLTTQVSLRNADPNIAATASPIVGCDLTVNVEVKSSGQSMTGIQVEARLQTPFSLDAITEEHRAHFELLAGHPIVADDAVPQKRAGWVHARQDILDAEGIDLFEPLEVPIVLNPSATNDRGVRMWSGTFPNTLLPGTYTFIVTARGWDPETAESWTRSGRISIYIASNPDRPLTEDPPMADPAGIPAAEPADLVTWSPGEEIDVDETGLTTSTVECSDPAQNRDPVDITNGAGHWVINLTGGATIGDLTSIGGGISPYLIKLAGPQPTSPIVRVNGFNVATDNWRFTTSPWPDSFDIALVPGAVRASAPGGAWESFPTAGLFPADTSGDRTLGLEPAWRITKLIGGSTPVTIGFLRRKVTPGVFPAPDTITQTWYADPAFLVTKTRGAITGRVLKSTTAAPWRFKNTTPNQREADRIWVTLTLTSP